MGAETSHGTAGPYRRARCRWSRVSSVLAWIIIALGIGLVGIPRTRAQSIVGNRCRVGGTRRYTANEGLTENYDRSGLRLMMSRAVAAPYAIRNTVSSSHRVSPTRRSRPASVVCGSPIANIARLTSATASAYRASYFSRVRFLRRDFIRLPPNGWRGTGEFSFDLFRK